MCRVIFTYGTYTVCVHKSTADNRPVRAPAATQHVISSQSAALCKAAVWQHSKVQPNAMWRYAPSRHLPRKGPNAESLRPTTKGDADAGMTSYCCVKELRLTRLRGSHSSCRISALDVRAAAAARITITMKRKLVTTVTVVSDL